MDPLSTRPEQDFLEELRRRRTELRGSMSALESAMAAPSSGDRDHWAQRVYVALVELSADLSTHVDITEGPDGLYREVLRTAPRLAGSVKALTSEHAVINARLDDLLARTDAAGGAVGAEDVERVRELGTALLGRLVRHRQRGSDLVYEAYELDIGGET